MKTSNFAASLAALLALFLFCSNAFAQSDDKKYFGKYTIEDLKSESADLQQFLNEILTVDIDIEEANVTTFFKELQKQSPIHLNVIRC